MFHVDVPLRTLLEAATVADMAVCIVQYQAAALDPAQLAHLLVEVEELSDEPST
jgi:hypothetical protein